MNAMRSRTLTRKTSLLRKIGPIATRSSLANKDHLQPAICLTTDNERRNDLEIVKSRANCFARSNSDRSPLYDVRNHANPDPGEDFGMRSDVSRTMWLRVIASAPGPPSLFRASARQPSPRSGLPGRSRRSLRRLVEPDGIEPTTSCLQSTRSPS